MSMSCGEFLSPRHNQRVSTYYYCLSLIFQDHKNCHTRRVWVDNSVCMLLTYGESSSTKHDPTPSTYCYPLSLIIHCWQWVQGLRIRCKVVEHPWVVHTASVIGQWYHMKKRTQPWNHDPCLVFCEFFCIQIWHGSSWFVGWKMQMRMNMRRNHVRLLFYNPVNHKVLYGEWSCMPRIVKCS